ncbi:RICIN domain-containing protein [Pseudomonas gingeri]|uniref:RICIN domain-containing protein n=1 Tax=Pseudomonas TaxID=286 RepID=UPI0015A0EDF9|nr:MULTISPECIES: RICIN domain-containing protein [Pseudomonas]NVZ62268.1 RICIN domain-containing protein [Pseudomonas gingeri]NVZ76239.1 RICIN domain-containing protein [Pseudomonas gingeri]
MKKSHNPPETATSDRTIEPDSEWPVIPDQPFRIFTALDERKFLCGSVVSVNITDDRDNKAAFWYETTGETSGFKILIFPTILCLTVTADDRVVLALPDNALRQQWDFEYAGGDWLAIRLHGFREKVLHVLSAEEGAGVSLEHRSSQSENQRFRLGAAPSGS